MARIVLGSYVVRYPLGGMMSWALQYLVGLQRLGHEVYFVEKATSTAACYDPARRIMTDDCVYGTRALRSALRPFGLHDSWCFVDIAGEYHGLTRNAIEAVFDSADLFIDMGTHGSWLAEAAGSRLRLLIDGEPGFRQMRMQDSPDEDNWNAYDHYATNGLNIGTVASSAPTAGKTWRHVLNPVVVDLFEVHPAPPAAPYTTIMNWQSHATIEFGGTVYGQKDVAFAAFMQLPSATTVGLEIAVAGKEVPEQALVDAGWRLQSAHEATMSLDSFTDYIRASRGEFSVCKHVFVATGSGWFSDRSAAYLASGRPVVLQDTGFSAHLPCGRGLFAVRDVQEAAAAFDQIEADYERHSGWARELAAELLDAPKVMGRLLDEIGV